MPLFSQTQKLDQCSVECGGGEQELMFAGNGHTTMSQRTQMFMGPANVLLSWQWLKERIRLGIAEGDAGFNRRIQLRRIPDLKEDQLVAAVPQAAQGVQQPFAAAEAIGEDRDQAAAAFLP